MRLLLYLSSFLCCGMLLGTALARTVQTDVVLSAKSKNDSEDPGKKIFRVEDTDPPKNRPLLLPNPVSIFQKFKIPTDIFPNTSDNNDTSRFPSFSTALFKNFTSKLTGSKLKSKVKPAVSTTTPPTTKYPATQEQYNPYDYAVHPYYYPTDPYHYYQHRDAYYNRYNPYYDNYENSHIIAISIPVEDSNKSSWILNSLLNATKA